ncbi:MAG: NnrU family protein [Geminicoccales bacterium]
MAFTLFFVSHSIPIRPPVKPWIVARIGGAGFTAIYVVLSLAVLSWLITAAGRAPFVELWPWAPWQSHITIALMLPACLILAMSVARPNPFSFGGRRNDRFEPAHPGVVRWMRHPILAALALWAIAHLLPNGDLAHVLVFGIFAAFAFLGGRMIDRRKRNEMGDGWQSLLTDVWGSPVIPRPRRYSAVVCRLAIGIGLYIGLILLHPWVLGVSPIS